MSANKSEKPSTVASAAAPFAAGIDWVKPITDASGKFFAEQLNFAARRLHAQADFLQNLADCKNPAELLQQQTKFFQTAVEEFSSEATRAWKVVQDTSALPRPQI